MYGAAKHSLRETDKQRQADRQTGRYKYTSIGARCDKFLNFYLPIYIHTYMHTYMYTYLYVCTYVCILNFIYLFIYTYIF